MGTENFYQLMKLNRLIKSHRPKLAGVWLLSLLRARHLFVRFDPVIACNLSCEMCFFSDPQYRKKNKGIFTAAEIERLAEMLFPKSLQVVFGCEAEPTLYREYPDLIRLAKSHGVPNVGIATNGQRFTEESISKMLTNGLDELLLSVHGVHKDNYEKFMAGASYETLHDVLGAFKRVKSRLGTSTPELRINYTVNSDNLEELQDFFQVFGQYGVDALQVRPIRDYGQNGYRKFDLARFAQRYAEILAGLQDECHARGVKLLAHKEIPDYKESGKQGQVDKQRDRTARKGAGSGPHLPGSSVGARASKPRKKPKPKPEVYGSLALDSVHRLVTPQQVWRPDFDWQTEDYEAFCKRIGFRKSLLQGVFLNPEKMARKNPFRGQLALSYDVL